MSQEKLQAFAEAVSKNEELQKRFASIQIEAVRSTAEKLAKLSESAGTPFTAEEYLKSLVESPEEMSTEQLRSVAGGGSSDPTWMNVFLSVATVLGGPNLGDAQNNCAVRAVRSIVDFRRSIDECLSLSRGG